MKKALELNLNEYQKADAKMELADILLLEEKIQSGAYLLFADSIGFKE